MKKERMAKSLKEESLNFTKSFYLNELELGSLSRVLGSSEIAILLFISLNQKSLYRKYKKCNNEFRIPYSQLESFAGMDKNTASRYVRSLRDKNILESLKPKWKFNIDGILQIIAPEVLKKREAEELGKKLTQHWSYKNQLGTEQIFNKLTYGNN